MLTKILTKILKVTFLAITAMAIQGCSHLQVFHQQVSTCQETQSLNEDYYLETEYDSVDYSLVPKEWLQDVMKENACLRSEK